MWDILVFVTGLRLKWYLLCASDSENEVGKHT